MKRILITLHLLVVTFFMMVSVAYAVPNLISYQGVLNDSEGVPISSTLMMTFSLYDVDAGGTAIWSETQSVQVASGFFNVKLGSVQQLTSSVFEQDTLYLGIQVGADPEMTPRQQITSGAYTYKADILGHAGMPIGSIMAWAKNIPGVPALAGGWVECNGQVLNDPDSPLNSQTIPDLNGQNRFLRGNSVSGGTGGEESHTLTIAEMPAHRHEYSSVKKTNSSPDYFAQGGTYPMPVETTSAGGDEPHENRPPFYNIVWIIKVK